MTNEIVKCVKCGSDNITVNNTASEVDEVVKYSSCDDCHTSYREVFRIAEVSTVEVVDGKFQYVLVK